MGTHSSILAWRIPRTEDPSGLQSMGSQRVRCNHIYILSLVPLSHILPFFFFFFIISTFSLSSYHFLLEFWLPRILLFGLECYCSTLKSTESVNMLGSIASGPIKQLLNTTL